MLNPTTITIFLCVCCALLLVLVFWLWNKLKAAKNTASKLALLDLDTQLGNVAFFEKQFQTIPPETRDRYCVMYIAVDSNYFSLQQNDSAFMYAVKHIANVLRTFEKQSDFSARITDNGLAIAFCRENPAQCIDKILERLNQYFQESGQKNRLYFHAAAYQLQSTDINAGFVLYNLRRNCSLLSDTTNQFVMCDAAMITRTVEEKQLLEKVEKGLSNNEFKMYLQFIVDNKTKHIVSAEALSRWQDSSGAIISPAKYIGVLEKYGHIHKLDYYMFEQVCQQLAAWKNTIFDEITISCNFTRITISESDFIQKIERIANKYDFDHHKLLIEITEDAIEKNLTVAMDNILKIKEFGFKIALDDIGNGYTSLINLCDYPIEIVKIDRDILLKTEHPRGKELFLGIISLVHSLRLKVVCEGVETEQQTALVSSSNCDYVQGFYYSKPMPQEKAEQFAKDYIANLQPTN